MLVRDFNSISVVVEGDPPFWYAVFIIFRSYIVRKKPVRSTQKSCCLVSRPNIYIKNL